MLTSAQLVSDGCEPNPHMWIGNGSLFCPTCQHRTLHTAFSHRGQSDCFEVCEGCGIYHGQRQLTSERTAA